MKSICYIILLTSVFLAGSGEMMLGHWLQQESTGVMMEIEYEKTVESESEQEADECFGADDSSRLSLSSIPQPFGQQAMYHIAALSIFDIPPEL